MNMLSTCAGGTEGDAKPKDLHVIDLNDVEMGDVGFRAMCDYLCITNKTREGSSESSAPGVNSHWRICLRYVSTSLAPTSSF